MSFPREAVPNVDRYKGTVEDERRLFYVAITAERYLFCTWSPIPGKNRYRRPSQFLGELCSSEYVLNEEPPVIGCRTLWRRGHAMMMRRWH